MAVAEGLYEHGYITYMRTDATFLSDQAITAARAQIRDRYGEEYLPSEPRKIRGGSRTPRRPTRRSGRPVTRCGSPTTSRAS